MGLSDYTASRGGLLNKVGTVMSCSSARGPISNHLKRILSRRKTRVYTCPEGHEIHISPEYHARSFCLDCNRFYGRRELEERS